MTAARIHSAWTWFVGADHSSCENAPDSFALRVFVYGLYGLGVAFLWTGAGYAIAYFQGSGSQFIADWIRMQAFFCLAFGYWLFLIARSGEFSRRIKLLTKKERAAPRGLTDTRLRALVMLAIWALGTSTFIGMGFHATGSLLTFLWAMCVFICFIAGAVTLHTLDLLLAIHNLQQVPLKLHLYSPARTLELRNIVSYFTFFTLLLTMTYGFAYVGTMNGIWIGSKTLIAIVQLFWPAIYVPICSLALLYPHLVVHKLVARVKESALSSYQREMDGLLGEYEKMRETDVQRINGLAQLFDRLNATPNYVVDLGIAVRTALPYIINLAIFLSKPLIGRI